MKEQEIWQAILGRITHLRPKHPLCAICQTKILPERFYEKIWTEYVRAELIIHREMICTDCISIKEKPNDPTTDV